MAFPFLDRTEERARLVRLLARPETALGVVYGRRRLGKSRLLTECLPPGRAVYFVGDGRGPALLRAALAAEIARLLPDFDRASYGDWGALLDRWVADAPRGAVLALDEFPELVAASPELPSLLQKLVDRRTKKPVPYQGKRAATASASGYPWRDSVIKERELAGFCFAFRARSGYGLLHWSNRIRIYEDF